MKGNIKKLAVFVIITAIAMFMVGMASAGNNNSVTGEYAVTGGMSCLVATSGFTTNFTPNDPASAASNSITFQGISTFERHGRGRLETIGVQITPSPVPSPQIPHANAFHFSFTFTYDVADDGTITIDADENSFQVKYDTGPPFTGATFTADKYSLSGLVSADHKTLTLGPPTTLIQTSTFQPPLVFAFQMICNGSYVFTRLGGKLPEMSQ